MPHDILFQLRPFWWNFKANCGISYIFFYVLQPGW